MEKKAFREISMSVQFTIHDMNAPRIGGRHVQNREVTVGRFEVRQSFSRGTFNFEIRRFRVFSRVSRIWCTSPPPKLTSPCLRIPDTELFCVQLFCTSVGETRESIDLTSSKSVDALISGHNLAGVCSPRKFCRFHAHFSVDY